MSIADRAPDSRSITVLADDALRNALNRLIEPLCLDVVGSGSTEGVENTIFGDIVLADIRDLSDPVAIDRLGEIVARTGNMRELVVRVTLDNLDAAIAVCPLADIVVGGDETELRLALAAAAARARGVPAVVSDVASDEGLRLQHLADEIARIARTLIDLPQGLVANDALSDGQTDYRAGPADDGAGEITATEVRRIIRLRRMRERFFSPELFADPAWDMLLDLAAARIERSRVAVSSLCIAASVPPTTALRWIKAMTDRGLLRRTADAHDARRIFIQLSDDAAAAMDKYLRAARANGGLAV